MRDLGIMTITWSSGALPGWLCNRLLVTLSGSRLYFAVEYLYEMLSWKKRKKRRRRRREREEEVAQSE